MTDAGGNSRFPAPAAHDQREREFVDGRPAGRALPNVIYTKEEKSRI